MTPRVDSLELVQKHHSTTHGPSIIYLSTLSMYLTL